MRRARVIEAAATTTIAIAVGCNALSGVADLSVCGDDECADATVAVGTSSGLDASSSSSTSSSGASTSSSSASSSSSSSSSSSGGNDGGDCIRPESGLLAYYPLEDPGASDEVKDCSGNARHGHVISPGTWGPGKFGKAFTTSDSAGCIDLGTPAALLLEEKSFTVAVWASAQSFGTSQLSYYLVGRTALPQSAGWRLGSDPSNQWSAKLYDKDLGLVFAGGPQDATMNTWTHIAATFSKGNAVTLYVNGAAAGSTPYTSALADGTATLRIGCRGDDKGYFHGSIDEVRIFDSALSATAVAAIAARVP